MIKEIAENEIMNILNEKVKEHVNKIEESIKDEKQFNEIQSCIDKISDEYEKEKVTEYT